MTRLKADDLRVGNLYWGKVNKQALFNASMSINPTPSTTKELTPEQTQEETAALTPISPYLFLITSIHSDDIIYICILSSFTDESLDKVMRFENLSRVETLDTLLPCHPDTLNYRFDNEPKLVITPALDSKQQFYLILQEHFMIVTENRNINPSKRRKMVSTSVSVEELARVRRLVGRVKALYEKIEDSDEEDDDSIEFEHDYVVMKQIFPWEVKVYSFDTYPVNSVVC